MEPNMKQQQVKKVTRPAANITINTGSNLFIGSAIYQNTGLQTAQAQTNTSQSFVQIYHKKTPTNKTSNQMSQVSYLQKGVTINQSAIQQSNLAHKSQSNGLGKERENFRSGNHVPIRDKSGGKSDALNSSNQNAKKYGNRFAVQSKNNSGYQNQKLGQDQIQNQQINSNSNPKADLGSQQSKSLQARHNNSSTYEPSQGGGGNSQMNNRVQNQGHPYPDNIIVNSNAKTNLKVNMVHQNYNNIIKIQNQHSSQERQVRNIRVDDNNNPNISYSEDHYVYSTQNTHGTNEKMYKQNNKNNVMQIQRKQPAVGGANGVVSVPSSQNHQNKLEPGSNISNRNNVDKMILKTRIVEMVENQSVNGVHNARIESGNSQGNNGNSLFGPKAGNMTSTSQTCNQSFHFGHSQQLGQALVSGSSRSKSKNRGGSSGSNQRTKARYRSGSNKNVKQQTKISKEVKTPQITINTNKDQIIQGVSVIGVSTTKTTKPTACRELRDVRESTYMTHHISTTKNRDTAQIQIQMKNDINKGNKSSTNKSSDGASGNQKIKFDQQTIKQKLQQQNEKFMMGGSNFSNLNIFQSQEPATTKSCKVEGGVNNSAITGSQSNQQRANFQIINMKQVGRFPGSSKNEETKAKFTGALKNQFQGTTAMINDARVERANTKTGGTHSNILNKLGQGNLISQKANQKAASKYQVQDQNNIKKANKQLQQHQTFSRSKGTILNTANTELNQKQSSEQKNTRQIQNAPAKSQESANYDHVTPDINDSCEGAGNIFIHQQNTMPSPHAQHLNQTNTNGGPKGISKNIGTFNRNEERRFYETISSDKNQSKTNQAFKNLNGTIKSNLTSNQQVVNSQTYNVTRVNGHNSTNVPQKPNTNTINQRLGSKSGQRKSAERHASANLNSKQNTTTEILPRNKNRPRVQNKFPQNSLEESKESGNNEGMNTFITNYDDIINASTDLVEFCDQKSQVSQRSKYSKQSKQSKNSKQVNRVVNKMISQTNESILTYSNNQVAQSNMTQIQGTNAVTQSREMPQSTGIVPKLSKQSLKTSSKNSSQSQHQSHQKLPTFIQSQMQLLSQSNLASQTQLQLDDQQSQDLNQASEKQQQIFYQEELKKRDNIVLFLCEKVQNMESQIELLRTAQNKSSIQNLSGLTAGPGSTSLGLAGPSGQNIGTQSQSMINQAHQISPINSSVQFTEVQQKKNQKKQVVNFYPKFGAPNKIEEEQSQQSNQQDSQNREKIKNMQILNDGGDIEYTDYMKIKLNDTSDNEGDNYIVPHQVIAPIDMTAEENSYEDTAGFILQENVMDSSIQQHYNNRGRQQAMRQNLTKSSPRGEKSQQRIQQAFMQMQDKLDKFQKRNNPKKIQADLRKYCATTITQNSKNNTGRISSRLQDSGGNSGGTGRNLNGGQSKNGGGTSGSNTNKTNTNGTITHHNRTTNRHFQSTSDAEINSLITVGEDYSKFTRASNRVSDRLNGESSKVPTADQLNGLIGNDSSPFVHSESIKKFNEGLGSVINKSNKQNKFQFKIENETFDERQKEIKKKNTLKIHQNEVDDSILLMQPDVKDIIAQGGLVDEGDPLMASAVNLEDDVSKVIIYEDMNYAINMVGVDDDIEIPRRRRDNMNDQINDSNPFQPQRRKDKKIDIRQDQFQDPDIDDLEKIVKMNNSDDHEQKNSTIISLNQQWENQQRNLSKNNIEEQDNKLENTDSNILTDFKLKHFGQTQKINFQSSSHIDDSIQEVSQTQMQQSFEGNIGPDESMNSSNMNQSKIYQYQQTMQFKNFSNYAQNKGSENTFGNGCLSKTLSKETLTQKLKKAKISGKKNVIVIKDINGFEQQSNISQLGQKKQKMKILPSKIAKQTSVQNNSNLFLKQGPGVLGIQPTIMQTTAKIPKFKIVQNKKINNYMQSNNCQNEIVNQSLNDNLNSMERQLRILDEQERNDQPVIYNQQLPQKNNQQNRTAIQQLQGQGQGQGQAQLQAQNQGSTTFQNILNISNENNSIGSSIHQLQTNNATNNMSINSQQMIADTTFQPINISDQQYYSQQNDSSNIKNFANNVQQAAQLQHQYVLQTPNKRTFLKKKKPVPVGATSSSTMMQTGGNQLIQKGQVNQSQNEIFKKLLKLSTQSHSQKREQVHPYQDLSHTNYGSTNKQINTTSSADSRQAYNTAEESSQQVYMEGIAKINLKHIQK